MLEDQSMYIQLGKTMAKTGSFIQDTNNDYTAVTDRLPGYPALLAAIYTLFGENNMAIVAVQILIDSLTCVVIGLIAESVVNRGFVIAGMVSALNLNMIILSGMILTDTLFLFLFSLFILFIFYYLKSTSKLHIILSISFLCVATLVRPVSYYLLLLLLPLLVVFLIWKKISLKNTVYSLMLYLIPVIIIFGPTHYRNYNEYNSFSLVSQGGGHALYWVVPATYQYSGQGSYQEGQVFAEDYIKHTMKRDNLSKLPDNPFEDSSYHMKVAKEALSELGLLNILHAWSAGSVINLLTPSAVYAPIVRSMDYSSFYATPGNGAVEKLLNYVTSTNSILYLSIIVIGAISSLIFLIISVFGFYKMVKFNRTNVQNIGIILFSLLIMTYILTITGPVVGVKYRLPIEPIMTLFIAYFYHENSKKDVLI
jgi:hypothetical protein